MIPLIVTLVLASVLGGLPVLFMYVLPRKRERDMKTYFFMNTIPADADERAVAQPYMTAVIEHLRKVRDEISAELRKYSDLEPIRGLDQAGKVESRIAEIRAVKARLRKAQTEYGEALWLLNFIYSKSNKPPTPVAGQEIPLTPGPGMSRA